MLTQTDLAAQTSAKLAALASAKLAPAANGRGMKYPAGVASASASGSGSAGSAAAVASATSASSVPRRTAGQGSLKSKAPLKRKTPAGTKALKEIRKYQNSTEMLFPKAPMARLFREIMLEIKAERNGKVDRMKGDAIDALMEATQAVGIDAMECMNDAAIHAKRVTIMPKDMKFMRKATGRFGAQEEHEEAMEAIAEAKQDFAENGRPTKVAKKTASASASSSPPKPADAAESDSDSEDDEKADAAVKAAAAKRIAAYRSVPALTLLEAAADASKRSPAEKEAEAAAAAADALLEDIDVVAKPAVISPPQAESPSAAAIAVPDEKDALTLAMEEVAADIIRVPVVLAAEAPVPEVKAVEPAVVAVPAPIVAPVAAVEDVVAAATAALAAEAAADKATLAAMLSAPVAAVPKRGRRAAASAAPVRKSTRAPVPRKDL